MNKLWGVVFGIIALVMLAALMSNFVGPLTLMVGPEAIAGFFSKFSFLGPNLVPKFVFLGKVAGWVVWVVIVLAVFNNNPISTHLGEAFIFSLVTALMVLGSSQGSFLLFKVCFVAINSVLTAVTFILFAALMYLNLFAGEIPDDQIDGRD